MKKAAAVAEEKKVVRKKVETPRKPEFHDEKNTVKNKTDK